MKKSLLWLVALLLLTASCNKTDEGQQLSVYGDEITLCSEVKSMTRSNNLELQSTQIVPGQMLGVYIYNASHAMNNSPWLVGEEGSLTNQRNKIYWAKNKNIDIVAYQPYMTDEELSNGVFTVKTDQSTDKMYQESDLLLATRSAAKQTAPVPLTFYHKLSKIMVRIVSDDAHFLDGAEVWVCDTKISTEFNPNEFCINPLEAKSDIKAAVLHENQLTAAAIVIPQTMSAGTKFIRIKVGDRMFFYRLQNSPTFESGYSYLYTLHLSLDDDAIKLMNYQLVDWDEEKSEAIFVDKREDSCIDLGLPSGLLWAACNVGAERQLDFGNYYNWYQLDEAVSDYGYYGWRIPTVADWQELIDNCTIIAEQINETRTLILKGQNENSLFLPCCGHYSRLEPSGGMGVNWQGRYWALESRDEDEGHQYSFTFESADSHVGYEYKSYFKSVRLVRSK